MAFARPLCFTGEYESFTFIYYFFSFYLFHLIYRTLDQRCNKDWLIMREISQLFNRHGTLDNNVEWNNRSHTSLILANVSSHSVPFFFPLWVQHYYSTFGIHIFSLKKAGKILFPAVKETKVVAENDNFSLSHLVLLHYRCEHWGLHLNLLIIN